AQVRHDGNVTLLVAREALAALEVDDAGLDDRDRSLLRAITDKFGGGPVGLETLAAAVNEDSETIEDVYEPYLLQEGYLKRPPRGPAPVQRVAAGRLPPNRRGEPVHRQPPRSALPPLHGADPESRGRSGPFDHGGKLAGPCERSGPTDLRPRAHARPGHSRDPL